MGKQQKSASFFLLLILYFILIALLIIGVVNGNTALTVITVLLMVVALFFLAISSKGMSKTEKRGKVGANYVNCIYVSGLNAPENVPCTLTDKLDKFDFEILGVVYGLEKEKIVDLSIVKDTDIQKQYVSSVGGAAMGALLAGPIGAAIGGRAKKKTITNRTDFLVFTYTAETVKYIVLKLTPHSDRMKIRGWIYDLRKDNKNAPKKTVDL